jgi:hypothetical protein
MVKSCKDIAKEIDELKRSLQQNKLVEMTLAEIADRKKCESNSVVDMCSNCVCWKSAREYCS